MNYTHHSWIDFRAYIFFIKTFSNPSGRQMLQVPNWDSDNTDSVPFSARDFCATVDNLLNRSTRKSFNLKMELENYPTVHMSYKKIIK